MADWVIVVDDDETNLKLAGRILSRNGIRVTALKSGQSLLEYMKTHEGPDLVLLDIMMPGMDGYETLINLRQVESGKDVPVIFLTGDEKRGAETKGLSLGAMDFIKKPFVPEVLNLRVRHTIDLDHLQKQLAKEVVIKTKEANTDAMTGLLNKAASEAAISKEIAETDGMLIMIDLDSFKLVNDLYGHDMGDKILIRFAELLRSVLREGDIPGRVGGDEFVAFCRHVNDREVLQQKCDVLNAEILKSAKEYMGEDMAIPLGVSMGAVCVPDYGNDFEDLRKKADAALYLVKQEGKHGCSMYANEDDKAVLQGADDINELQMVYGERNIQKGAVLVGGETFRSIYRYLVRFAINYPVEIRFVSFEIEGEQAVDLNEITEEFAKLSSSVLRISDVVVCHSPGRVLMLLPKADGENWTVPVNRVLETWKSEGKANVEISYTSKKL
ncbi:MAG: diguanylate cyclase [Lachnospiraceae bacterium]|nr:diguanylate cyclase [Lachnospiraceae bacterium]